MTDRKLLPPAERRAIQAWIRDQLDGRKLTQSQLGEELGGVSQPAIGKAYHRAEVGPVIRDAILSHLGIGRDAFLAQWGERESSVPPSGDAETWETYAAANQIDPDDPDAEGLKIQFHGLKSMRDGLAFQASALRKAKAEKLGKAARDSRKVDDDEF